MHTSAKITRECSIPTNIRLDEDVLKTSFVFRRCLDQSEYIRLSHPSSGRLDQDKYIRLGHTSLRHLQDYYQVKLFLLNGLQDVFKTYSTYFSTFLRRTAAKKIWRKICLGHTSEIFMARVLKSELFGYTKNYLWIYRNF